MNRFARLALVALSGALLAACGTAPRDGSEEAKYYYSNRGTSAVANVVVNPPPPLPNGGPIGVARIVYFDFDKSQVKPEYRRVVEAHARYLSERPASRVVLEGHTDIRGGRSYNVALGQRRAEAVRQSMLLLGVRGHQIEAVSFGMEKLASTGLAEADHQLNRRVEFSYR